jgi:hypothetical protein
MFDEIRKSIQLILYERITSPLSGALLFSWFVWNWKIPYLLFFDGNLLPFAKKLEYVENNYFTYDHNLYFPILSPLFLTLVYPFATTGILNVWLRFKKWQNSIKNQIEGSQLLTQDQSLQLRLQLRHQQDEFSDLLRAKDEEIETLKSERNTLIDKINSLSPTSSETAKLSLPKLSEKATTLLLEGSQDPRGGIMVVEYGGGKFIQVNTKNLGNDGDPRDEAEWDVAIDELQNSGYIKYKSENYYLVTDAGFKLADKIRSAT